MLYFTILISVDIPAHKLRNKKFGRFVGKYTEHKVPSETVIREKYMGKSFEKYLQAVRNLLKDDIVYVSTDGTIDNCGRSAAAFIVGSLSNPMNGPFLIDMKEMKSGSADAYLQFFNESLDVLYKDTGELMDCFRKNFTKQISKL